MSIENWPTLSRVPKSVKSRKHDGTIRTSLADGLQLSMATATTQRWEFWIAYHGMTDADYTMIDAFENARRIGAEVFRWVHPTRATIHTVSLAEAIAYNLDEETHLWQFECHFIEPGGTYD